MATAKSRYGDKDAAAKAFDDMPLLSRSDAHTTVEIHVQARGLEVLDTFSKSDPFARLLLVQNGLADVEIGRTEVIPNTQEANWTIGFRVDYHFEEVQTFRLEVWDEDKVGSVNMNDHQLQGWCLFTMGELMSNGECSLNKTLKCEKKSMLGGSALKVAGTVTLRGEELIASSEFLQLGLRGKQLANKDGFFSKSDPYFEIHKAREDGTWVPVYRSIYIKNTLNPVWPTARRISIQTICNGDYDRPLRIEVYDIDNDGSHDDMGRTETNVRELLRLGTMPVSKQQGLPVIETKKNGKTKHSGSLYVDESGIMKYDTFVDYISSGWELNMMIAIDFTGSNGNPADPRSLHYRDPQGQRPNQYEQAIRSLGEVISQYDNDGLYPTYGFGGKIPGGIASHCFALNQNPQNPSVQGIQGILDAYASGLATWGLSGPTIFTQITNAAAALAQHSAPDPKVSGSEPGDYTILLVLTDGIITDLEQTKDAIVQASHLPLSIIIIGVGDADFSAMDALDSDERLLTDQRGRVAKRDIVQFVKFNDFKDDRGIVSSSRLAQATLEELPAQMLGYFNQNHIRPKIKAGLTMKSQTDGQATIQATVGGGGGGGVMPPPPPPTSSGGQGSIVTYLNVCVPEGVRGGDRIEVTKPDGKGVVVQVPAGLVAGQQFQISVSSPAQPQTPNRDQMAALGKSLLSQNLNP
mmetsp:Transcript_34942/g.45060  ORF Transcript_34942/g.45060 Transcript_34942/m.45060 type:complete len:693 (+) Transcript_34942:37-2115(+)